MYICIKYSWKDTEETSNTSCLKNKELVIWEDEVGGKCVICSFISFLSFSCHMYILLNIEMNDFLLLKNKEGMFSLQIVC